MEGNLTAPLEGTKLLSAALPAAETASPAANGNVEFVGNIDVGIKAISSHSFVCFLQRRRKKKYYLMVLININKMQRLQSPVSCR